MTSQPEDLEQYLPHHPYFKGRGAGSITLDGHNAELINCFATISDQGFFYLCIDYALEGEKKEAMVAVPYSRDLQQLHFQDERNEVRASFGAYELFAYWSNGYDFIRNSKGYFANTAATRQKPSIAFTIRNSSVMGGGPITVYRYVNWLCDLGFKVAVYSDDDAPGWAGLQTSFYRIDHDNLRYGAITEPIIIIYSLLEIPLLLRYCHHANKRIFHLCQGLEEFHVSRPPGSSIDRPAPLFHILNALPVGRIVVSPHLRNYFSEIYGQKAHTIMNGIDLGVFSPKAKETRENDFTILTIGDPHHPLKGIGTVTDALAIVAEKHPHWRLHLINVCGQPTVMKTAPSLPFTQTFLCRLTPEEMREKYYEADAYVNASWYEGFGLPSLEAMACGTPVVQVGNHGLDGIAEDDRNCLLVPEQDAEQIAGALEKILTDEKMRTALIHGGIETASRFSLADQFSTFVSEFQEILGVDFDPKTIATKKKALEESMHKRPPVPSRETEKVLFSILVPTYNQANFLPATLDSILAQDYPHWEALVVNDGSTDDTAAVMERYAGMDSRIRTFHKENGGVASALNLGLQHVSGEWICWLSSDDLFEPGKLSLHLETIRNHPDVRFMHTNYSLLYDQTGEKVTVERNSEELNDPTRQLASFFEANQVNGISIAIHRQVFNQVGHFAEQLRNGQDFDMWLRIVCRYQPLYLDERTVITRIHPAQGTSLSVEAGIYDSGRSCLDFLNNHRFPAIFPKLDLNDTGHALQAVQLTLHILANPNSLVNLCGYGPALLERMHEWLSTLANNELQAQLSSHLPGIIQSFQQDFYPEEIRQAFLLLPSSFDLPFSYSKHDPLQDLEMKGECLDREHKVAEASALRKYLAKATGADTSFTTNVPFWQKLQEDGYFEKHPLYGKEHNGLKLFGNDDDFVQRFLPLKQEMTVVVIGCGYGRESALLARRVKHVYGIDVSRTLLDKTEKFMAEQGITNFTAVLAEEWEKVIPQGIDLVYSIVVFQHLTKDLVRNYVNGLSGKLAPGGRFLCQFCDAQGASDDAHLAAYEPNVRWSVEEIEELIEKSGLEKVTIEESQVAEEVKWYWAFFGNRGKAASALPKPPLHESPAHEPPEAAYQAAMALATAGKTAEACASLESLVLSSPDFALAHNDLGVLYSNQGMTEKAHHYHEQAVQLEPGNRIFQKNLADFYQVVLDRSQEALEIYVKLLATEPKDLEVLTALGQLCITQDKPADAEYFFTRALEIEPWNMETRQSLEALRNFNLQPAPTTAADNPQQRYQQAVTSANDGQFAEAIDALEEVLQMDPEFALAHNDLGVLYGNQGRLDKALSHYEEAARLQPANVTFQKNLADFYHVAMGRTEEALQIYVKLLAVQPKDLEVLTALGNLCTSLDRLDDAVYFFTRALEVEPWNGEIRESLKALKDFAGSTPTPAAPAVESGNEAPATAPAAEVPALHAKKQQVLKNSGREPIDIIFLTYNRRDYFEKTIKALIERTRYPYRIIVVDNHSREDFRRYLQDTAILYDHLVLNDDNYFTVAFQRGIELATSDPYVVSDPDIIVPDLQGKCWLERMLDLHLEYPEMGLIGLTLDPVNKPKSLPDVILGEKTVYNDKLTLANVGTWMQCIKRQYFDGKYTTDWEACEQVRKNGGKVGFVREFVAYHLGYDEERDHPDHLVEKYHLFKEMFGSDLYSMYTDSEELLAKMGEKPAAYYGFSRPEVQEMVNPAAKRILDVGCAAGNLGSELKSKLGAEVWGIECQPEAAGLAAKKLDKLLTGTVEEKLAEVPDGYFDTIIFADVLEHLRDPAAILSAARAKLAAGGEIVGSIPNVRHWSVVKGLLEGKWDYADEGILDRTHLRFFTRQGVMELFGNAGFTPTTMSATVLNDVQVPPQIPKALAEAGLEVETLAEESRHYQYLLRAVPQQARQAKPVSLPPAKEDKPAQVKVAAGTSALTSIIILTFNQLEYTRECLAGIQKHTPENHEIIFVDNGSKDGTVKWLRQQMKSYKNYRLIENKKNLGFAKGCNQGMAAAKGEYLLLLNNDVVVTEGWLTGMRECLEASPEYGIVGPMTNSIASPQQLLSVPYAKMDEMQAFAAGFRASHRHRRIPVKLVVGFCMLFRRSLFETVGMLDEAFVLGNFEDDDFCLRASLAGLQSVIAGDVFIHHHGSRTFAGNKIDFNAAMAVSRKVFDRKWDLTKMDKSEAFRLASHNASIKAEESFHRGDLERAVKILIEEGIKFSPADRRPYRLLASFLMESKRFDDGLAIVREMPGCGQEADSLVLEGICREGLGQFSEAEGCADRALAMESSFAPALNLKGVLAFQSGDRSRAEELFTSAMAADPGFGEASTNLGVLRWSAQAHDEALDLLEKGFILNPAASDAMERYHTAITAGEQFGRGEAAFREARTVFPMSRLLNFKLIDLLLNQQKYEEAMAEIEQCMIRFGTDDGIIDAALHVREKLDGLQERARSGKPGNISLCMIAKDEAPHLARALASVKPVVSEMIVVDTGSSDRTKDIAMAFGASVFDLPWPGSFALARNESLAKASGQWILVMDADEVISCRDHELLRQLAAGKPAGYTLCQKNYTDMVNTRGWQPNDGRYPEEEVASGFQPNHIVRFFPNDSRIRFENPVHELVEPSLRRAGLPIKKADLPIHHYGKLDREKLRNKWEFYYELGIRKIAEGDGDVKALSELAIQAAELEKYDESLELWRQVVEREPELAQAHFNMGYAYLCQGRYGEALCSSKRAVELDPHVKEAVFNYGCCQLYAGEIGSVAALLEKLLVEHPDYPPAMALLASIHFCLGEQDKGKQRLQQVRELNYDCGDFLFQHAKVLYSQGRFDWSRRLLEAAIDNGAVTAEITSLLTECTRRAA